MTKAAIPPSDCKEILRHLEAYLDGELADDSLKQCVQTHLKTCSSCQAELDVLKALHDQLRDLSALVVSKRLSERVGDLTLDWTRSQRNRSTSLLPRRMALIIGVSAVSLIAVSALGIWLWSAQDDEGDRQSAVRGDLIAFVDDYVAYVQSDSAPVVETLDSNEMEGWLAARLDFAPKLPRWSSAELIRGRLCFIHNRRIARVEYKVGESDLTLFIQPLREGEIEGGEEDRTMNSLKTQSLRGFEVACWRSSELDYVLVGPASSADLFASLEIGRQGD
ncbi:MAG: zf-HC2 domain-containing protein [Candidatus Hydrogenedentes bacterium]|nr:zf-HC2 domain-containing protein [Candidatus Hydrogenedentota bacterium]